MVNEQTIREMFGLQSKEGAIAHFRYKPPTAETVPKFELVTTQFILLVSEVYDLMPSGPGKTLALRKLSEARMAVNSAIANEGQ